MGSCPFSNEGKGGDGLLDLMMTGMNAGEIAVTTIAGCQDHSAGQRGLQPGEDVETVNPEFLVAELGGWEFLLSTAGPGVIRTRTAVDRVTLSGGQFIAIADQFRTRTERIAVAEEST